MQEGSVSCSSEKPGRGHSLSDRHNSLLQCHILDKLPLRESLELGDRLPLGGERRDAKDAVRIGRDFGAQVSKTRATGGVGDAEDEVQSVRGREDGEADLRVKGVSVVRQRRTAVAHHYRRWLEAHEESNASASSEPRRSYTAPFLTCSELGAAPPLRASPATARSQRQSIQVARERFAMPATGAVDS